MLNVAVKASKTTEEPTEGASRGNGRNGGAGKTRSQTVSVLGGGMVVKGDVSGEGEFRIQGTVEGSVSTTGRVIVEASGEVKGDVEAAEVVASGKVFGKITASGSVRLESGCEITADIHAAVISLEEGGIVNGTLEMATPRKP